ncbi:MAG: hypothetical protein KatS3mg080_0897 [Anoxybacillus sp.]|nr:MAG: hypothetical protein KatS3mg080_0897 [Anoxybacillus sp.]
MTFENNREWNAKIFRGVIEAAGRDHLILSDPQTGMRYLLPMIYLDYVTFDEEINYEYPFASGGGIKHICSALKTRRQTRLVLHLFYRDIR